MKLAILGSNALALEAAIRFHSYGAQLTWFDAEPWHPEDQSVSKIGLELLGRGFVRDWGVEYLAALRELLSREHKVKHHPVIAVTKRFLAPGEVPQGSSRFLDLFRLIYQVNPKDFIDQQKEKDAETYQRLSEEFLTSLQENLEMYEDFDLVLDLRSSLAHPSVAVTGRAIGEQRISSDYVLRGQAALSFATQLRDNDEIRDLALIGDSGLAAEILISLADWMKDARMRLFVVTHEEDPFVSFLAEGRGDLVTKLNGVFQSVEQDFRLEVEEFQRKLREWQELDDFVQVKLPRPVEPIPRLVFFSGHNATAVDQLIDKRRLFLTLEKPEFRDGKKHVENNALELKTIGVDRILLAGHGRKAALELALDDRETGYFSLAVLDPQIAGAWEKNLEHLKGIEDEIFKLFSPADPQ